MQQAKAEGGPIWPKKAITPAADRAASHATDAMTRPAFVGADMVPLAAWQCDLTDNSLKWSAGVYALFGLDPAESPDRDRVVAMYSDESRAELDRLRTNAVARGESFTFEADIRRPTGEWRRMRVTADVVMTNGRPTHLYGSKQDITDEAD